MPVLSCHCFANHRGGVGKTTLTYQVSAAYAVAHPDCNVLVIDTTDSGDVSEMLMGGVYEKRGRETLRKLIPVSNVTQLFLRALVASSSSTATSTNHLLNDGNDNNSSQPANGRTHSDQLLSNVIQNMPICKKASNPLDKAKNFGYVDVEECAIPLKEVNNRLPSNMYICPSGVELEQAISFSETQRQDIVSVLLQSFQKVPGKWKVFVDTDTGLHGENGAYATIGLGIADFLFIPLHADMSDWYGAQVLLHDLQVLHGMQDSHAQVHLILWNGLNVQFKHAWVGASPGRSNRSGFFVPTKAEQDICMTLGNLVYQEAEKQPNLFALYDDLKTRTDAAESFSVESCCSVRSFGVIGVASKDVGVPIACLKPGVFHGVHMSYNLNNDTIQHSRENLEEVVKAIDEVDETMNPRKRCRDHSEALYKEKHMEERSLGLPVSTANTNARRNKSGRGRGSGKCSGLLASFPKKRELHASTSTCSSSSRKAKNAAAAVADSIMFKTYALRNKYCLRDRSKKMKTKFFFLDFLHSGNTSTVNNMS